MPDTHLGHPTPVLLVKLRTKEISQNWTAAEANVLRSPQLGNRPMSGIVGEIDGVVFSLSNSSKDLGEIRPENTHDHGACVADAVAAAETRLSLAAANLTPLRRQVLELICASHVPVGAYDLLARLGREREGRAAPPTIYRALDFLLEHGLIHRINSLNAYVACFGPHRPHDACLLICERCRAVEEIEAEALRRAIEKQAVGAGFDVRGQTIEVTGLCRTCGTQA